MLLSCVRAPNLPSTDTIVAIEPIKSGFIASSTKYCYVFTSDNTLQEYLRYKKFYEKFHLIALGASINFAVDEHAVTAEYIVLIDNSKLNNEQYSVLINEYKSIQVDKDHLGVLFKAKGGWRDLRPEDHSSQYRLERPFVVSINDKTVKITELGAWVISHYYR